ncbi:hypothetical protein L861_01755 [Litchfieldella anticariensis FP35 = DSM 16096]|uniref:Bacterial transcriptional activator domain-containing protein n=1 Tax=Litchfieldella anticariensis (strain DSM 16096 / CECT 5854 / CIP 108499 / LMG 22089 / FP35) TaxID=1121939 RepID=S2LHB7_LITA3|nr:BTAD domain-containing putative transcriptional regulator [Halomonas anticariensis]EPC04056.1 hypothetical protein L861_01755 [Halomonas anticariensis FP35 = DSM 16096]
MSALTLNFLGDLEVVRDGQVLPLPPSKKTRALLAYLALHTRPLSREHLCDLLWELPDDPRGSLRWSLSKLRRLVDEPGRTRIVADRLCAGIDTTDIDIDVMTLRTLVEQGVEQASTEALETAARRYRGPFLEGLDLSRFHDFHSWCLAEREQASRIQTTLLAALIQRLVDTPDRALPHAHSHVRLAPYDETVRARLIRLLLALNRREEAEKQYQLGIRMLKEAGVAPTGELHHTWRHSTRRTVSAPHPPLAADHAAHLDDDVRDVLHWAAVLTPCLDAAWLGRVTRLDADRIGEALETAERLNLLETIEHGLRFSDERLAQHTYQEIAPVRRQLMHRRIAEILIQDPALDLEHTADLEHHAQLSGDPLLAAQAMVVAGHLCLRFFANEEALRFAHKGIDMAERLSGTRRVRLLLELRDVMLSAAPVDDWKATAEELVTLAECALEHGALAHARLGYQLASHVRWAHGQWADAREEALQSERVTRSADDSEQIIAMAETAKCLAMLERDLDQAEAMLAEAQTLAARQRINHPAIPMALGLLEFHDNRLGAAEEHFKEARTLCKASGDRLSEFQANEYLMMIDFVRAHYDSARARCAALMEIGAKLRDGSEAPFAHAAHGLCLYAVEDDPVSLAASLEDLRNADAKHRLAYLLTHAALLDMQRGRLNDAVTHAEEALAHAQILERNTELMLAHHVLAEAYRTTGDFAAHQRHMSAVAEFDQAPVAQWARCLTSRLVDGTEQGKEA